LAAVIASVCFGGALIALHGFTLRFPFIADDFLFLDEAGASGARPSLARLALAINYFRPVGRALYFFALSHLFGPNPVLFRLFNWLVLLVTLALVIVLARRYLGTRAAVLAGGVYALLYPHRVLMAWISCSQDLLATALGLAATLLYLRGKRVFAGSAFFVGLLAKESIAALPLVLLLWEAWESGATLRARWTGGLRKTASLWIAMGAWLVIILAVRTATHSWNPGAGALPMADVALQPGGLWEGLRFGLLSYFYLDQPLADLGNAAARVAWPVLAIVLVVAGAIIAFTIPKGAGARPGNSAPGWRLGLLWATVGLLPVALVGHHFSAYYISFAAVGFALLAGLFLSRTAWPVVAGIFVVAAWANVVANGVEPFRLVREGVEPPGISYVSISRLEWERKFVDALHDALKRDPPPKGGVIYLAHAPHYLELATFGERAPRIWFHDPTLDLSYITRYRIEGDRPRRFLRFDPRHWNFVSLPNALVDAMVEGEEALAAGRPGVARPALERALALAVPGTHDIERAELETSYGLACFQTGDTESARRAWLAALAIDPANRGALLNLAAWNAGRGDFREARILTLRTLALDGRDPVALYYLSRVERSLGNETGSRRAWEELASAEPAFADSVARRDGQP
jgi:tetratricopeptide (TPR) repeat protein